MKTKIINIDVKAIGVKETMKSIQLLSKSVENFFEIGKKYKIPKTMLMKMLSWQIDRKNTVPTVDVNKLKFK